MCGDNVADRSPGHYLYHPSVVVSLRDDGDPPLTLRCLILGTAVMICNCAVTQVYSAKPVTLSFSNVFVILLTWALLLLWQTVMPKESWVDRVPWLSL
jgi:hypothetical protein